MSYTDGMGWGIPDHHHMLWWHHRLYNSTPVSPRCFGCYDREWIPVSLDTFIKCYGLRLTAGMEVDISEKIRECSVYVGHCTCSR